MKSSRGKRHFLSVSFITLPDLANKNTWLSVRFEFNKNYQSFFVKQKVYEAPLSKNVESNSGNITYDTLQQSTGRIIQEMRMNKGLQNLNDVACMVI